MAKNNIDIVGSELVIERIVTLGDVSPYSISFESPTVELVLDRIKFYERGIYKISLGLTDINEIGGVVPTDIVDAKDEILVAIGTLGVGGLTHSTLVLDGNTVDVVRANNVQGVEPTAIEVPNPIKGDRANIFLTNDLQELWSYNTSWTLIKTLNNAIIADASETVKGKIEIATTAEGVAGSDATKASTPSSVKAYVDTVIIESATDLTGVAPANAELGINTTTGTLFYVNGGNWTAAPTGTPEVIESTNPLTGVAPSGAKWGVNTATGDLFYVSGGSWIAYTSASSLIPRGTVNSSSTILNNGIYKLDSLGGTFTTTLPTATGSQSILLLHASEPTLGGISSDGSTDNLTGSSEALTSNESQQTFVSTLNGELQSISYQADAAGTIIKIYEGVGLNGALLATSSPTTIAANVGTGVMPSGVLLTAGNVYTVSMANPNPNTDFIRKTTIELFPGYDFIDGNGVVTAGHDQCMQLNVASVTTPSIVNIIPQAGEEINSKTNQIYEVKGDGRVVTLIDAGVGNWKIQAPQDPTYAGGWYDDLAEVGNTSLHVGGNNINNRKVVLYDGNRTSAHRFHGFGVNPFTLRYQLSDTSSFYRWFAATGDSSSNEVMTLTGAGRLGINGVPNPAAEVDINGAGVIGKFTVKASRDVSINPYVLNNTVPGVTSAGVDTPLPAQRFIREAIAGVSFASTMDISIGKYTAGTSAATEASFVLGHGNSNTPNTTVLKLKSNGVINMPIAQVFADDVAASSLKVGDLYTTPDGFVRRKMT